MHLFIIPGNPPALYFYKLWAEEIQREHPGCSVYVSPYPHLPMSRNSYRYLSDTAAMHGKELLAFYQTVQQQVTIVGHSLGAWMALSLVKEHDKIIENCFLLHPFLQRPSLKGRVILKSLRSLYKIPFAKDVLFCCRGILERFFEDLKYVTDEELRMSLTLAYHEYTAIGRYRGTLQISERLRNKLHMIYCDQDIWCPPHTVHEIKKWMSCEQTEARHDFITSSQGRAIVLKALRI